MLLIITPYNLYIFVWLTKILTHKIPFQLKLCRLNKQALPHHVPALSVKECEVIKNVPHVFLPTFNPSLVPWRCLALYLKLPLLWLSQFNTFTTRQMGRLGDSFTEIPSLQGSLCVKQGAVAHSHVWNFSLSNSTLFTWGCDTQVITSSPSHLPSFCSPCPHPVDLAL